MRSSNRHVCCSVVYWRQARSNDSKSNILVYIVKFSTKSYTHSTVIICFSFPHQIRSFASNAHRDIAGLISHEVVCVGMYVCVYVCTCRLTPQIKQLDVVNAYSIQLLRHSIFDSSAKLHTYIQTHTYIYLHTDIYQFSHLLTQIFPRGFAAWHMFVKSELTCRKYYS